MKFLAGYIERCYGQTDRRTDRSTDKAGYRIACTRLKTYLPARLGFSLEPCHSTSLLPTWEMRILTPCLSFLLVLSRRHANDRVPTLLEELSSTSTFTLPSPPPPPTPSRLHLYIHLFAERVNSSSSLP